MSTGFVQASDRITTHDEATSRTGTRPTNVFLVQDLEITSRTRTLADGDLDALRAVAGWIDAFVSKPHKDLGRTGPVCPFVPGALERKTLWLAPERVADRTTLDVVQLVKSYKKQFQDAQPIDGDGVNYKAIVVAFTDLSADRAKDFFDEVLKQLAVPSYADDGLVLGAFYEGNQGTAIYNRSFRPFTPPVPFLLMRHAVVSDWKFFLDDRDWLDLWAKRYGASGVHALAEELRRLPWRETRD
jgi:hypothetical protein